MRNRTIESSLAGNQFAYVDQESLYFDEVDHIGRPSSDALLQK